MRITVMMILFTLAVLLTQFLTPAMEGMDEPVHYNYVEYLRIENRLPDRATYLTNSTRQASGQPPLAYWLTTLPLRILNPASEDGELLLNDLYHVIRNRWVIPNMNTSNRRDNLNLYYHGRDEDAFGHPLVVNKMHIMRLVSLVLALIASAGAYAASREIFPKSSWAFVSTALFAFTPTLLSAGSAVTNDIGAICFGTLAIWQTLRLLRRGSTPFTLMLMGSFIGLAALSKINGLLIFPGVLVAILLETRNNRPAIRRLLINSSWFIIPFVLLFAPWVFYGTVQYHDPIGINTHQHGDPRYYFASLRPLSEIISLFPDFYVTYWGNVSPRGTNVFSYAVLSLVPIAAGIGYLINIHSTKTLKTRFRSVLVQQVVILVIIVLAMVIAIVYWMQRQSDVWARLIYPAQSAVALLLTIGLYGLAQRYRQLKYPFQYGTMGLILIVGLVFNPLTLLLTYGLPRFISNNPQPLHGPMIDFDHTIRFLGYKQPSNQVLTDKHNITLCWEVLQATSKPAVFSVKFIHDGQIIADRTSIHGLGHFNSVSWQAGDRFCDQFDIFVDDPDVPDDPPPAPGQVYDILVTILNAKTLEADWQATTTDNIPLQFPFVGQVVSPAGDMSTNVKHAWQPADITFPNFARLLGYSLNESATPGAKLKLNLLWSVEQNTPDSWLQFIHLNGPNGSVSLVDGIPRDGNYPTWAWSADEKIVDQWSIQIPQRLSAGDYSIEIGFYQQNGNQRMPALQVNQSVTDNSPVLLHFHVD